MTLCLWLLGCTLLFSQYTQLSRADLRAPLIQWKKPRPFTGFLSSWRAQEILYLDCNDRVFVGHRVGNAGRVGAAGKHGLFVHILHGDRQHGHVLSKQAWKKHRWTTLTVSFSPFISNKLKRITSPVWVANSKHVAIAPLECHSKQKVTWTLDSCSRGDFSVCLN